MNHLEFAARESEALRPTTWEIWAEEVESILGHGIDGDQLTDGYSLDFAHKAYRYGLSPMEHSTAVRIAKDALWGRRTVK